MVVAACLHLCNLLQSPPHLPNKRPRKGIQDKEALALDLLPTGKAIVLTESDWVRRQPRLTSTAARLLILSPLATMDCHPTRMTVLPRQLTTSSKTRLPASATICLQLNCREYGTIGLHLTLPRSTQAQRALPTTVVTCPTRPSNTRIKCCPHIKVRRLLHHFRSPFGGTPKTRRSLSRRECGSTRLGNGMRGFPDRRR